METGDTYLDEKELLSMVRSYLSFTVEDDEFLIPPYEALILNGYIIKIDKDVSDYRIYNSEKYIAKKMI